MRLHRPSGFTPARAGMLLCALALAACNDRGGPTGAAPPVEETPALQLTQLKCTASVRAKTVSCAQPGAGDARGLIVGGQNLYVKLTSDTPVYTPADSVFAFGVTVQNLIPQAMGTADGATGSANGVRVFFASTPAATTGSGEIAVTADGMETYTEANQPYFQYAGADLGADGILSPDEVSASRRWEMKVPQSVETFVFTLLVSADVRYPDGWVEITPDSTRMLAGGAQALTAVVKSAVGNTLSGEEITWGTTDAAVATVDASGQVTAVAPGTVSITAAAGSRAGAATLQVCPDLAVGGAYTFGSAAAAAVCVHGGAAGAEFTLVPVNMSPSANLALVATASGATAAAGPPNPSVGPAGLGLRLSSSAQLDARDDWENALRERERRELSPIFTSGRVQRGARRGGARFNITAGVPEVGDTMILNSRSNSACGAPTLKTAVVKVVSTHLIVVADTGNPTAGGFTQADYDELAAQFDTFVYPTVTGVAGEPEDIDENGRVIAFYTEAVNQLSTPGSGSYVGGFVYSRDLFSTESCAGSNQGEMFYMLAADSLGENGNQFPASVIKRTTIGTLGHEFQHLINASRRIYVNDASGYESRWMDEGLAHIMEELLFYRASGLSARSNGTLRGNIATAREINAWNNYASSNFSRLRTWMVRPDTSGLFELDDDLSTRGAIWAFLRYAADRRGGDEQTTWNALINSKIAGTANLQAVLGADPLPWMRDWVAAMHADDAVTGTGAQHRNASWNFRSFWAGAGTLGATFPLGTRNLGDGTETFTLQPGASGAFLRFGVPANTYGNLKLTSASAPFPLMQVTLMRTK